MDKGFILKDIRNPALRTIAEKVIEDSPISTDDALTILNTNNILELGLISDHIRKRLHGDKTFYSVNMNLNYTNVCELRCPLCAFSCDPSDPKAYVLSIDQIEQRVKNAAKNGIDEVHIVGGLNPELKLEYFEDMIRRIRAVKPDIYIVGFTAVEYDYFARINNIGIEEVFSRMTNAGVNALPGGGAEIFDQDIRDTIAPKKISGKRWLEIMRIAHELGLKTNATLLYNHLEGPNEIVDHLHRIRSLQDATGGFKTFVPLPFHDANTSIRAKSATTTGFQDIRLFAAARIFLHNVPHIKALWMYLGEKMAQTLLCFGADDIGGTYHHERVVHSAGASTSDTGSERHIRRLIESAGLSPVRITADYTTKEVR